VTVGLHPWTRDLAERTYLELEAHRLLAPDRGTLRLWKDSDGGSTLYINKRDADWYLRLYNKHAESPNTPRYHAAWRWEVECKHAAAARVVDLCSPSPSRAAAVSGIVFDQFFRRGALPPWKPTGDPVYCRGFRRRADAERRLDWFEQQVKPVIAWFAERGELPGALRRLGLTHLDGSPKIDTGQSGQSSEPPRPESGQQAP
jgi:DNA relaxase NicK